MTIAEMIQEFYHEERAVEIFERLSDKSSDINAVAATFRRTPLHWVAYCGNCPLVKLLIDNGANVNAEDDSGWTPLHLTSSLRVAKLLIDNGADVNAKNSDGMTALHWRARTGYPEVVELLLKSGANPNIKNRHGLKPIYYALTDEIRVMLTKTRKQKKVMKKKGSGK